MKVWTRKRLRSGHFLGRKLRIGYRGQLLAAKMVDSSDQGLGVEMSAPREIDSFVSFVGVGLRGRAQVVHCRPSDCPASAGNGEQRSAVKLTAGKLRRPLWSRFLRPGNHLLQDVLDFLRLEAEWPRFSFVGNPTVRSDHVDAIRPGRVSDLGGVIEIVA